MTDVTRPHLTRGEEARRQHDRTNVRTFLAPWRDPRFTRREQISLRKQARDMRAAPVPIREKWWSQFTAAVANKIAEAFR